MKALTLERLRGALAACGERVYRYAAAPNTAPPYLVWGEDGDNDLSADDRHAERCWTGTVDLYTRTEDDPLTRAVPAALEGVGAAWSLNSVQYEEDTGLIHYEWVWEAV